MRTIALRAVPNQRLSVTIDGVRWELEIKQAQTSMVATIWADDVLLISGTRIVAGTPILPYRHLTPAGNFLMFTELEQMPDWQNFESDQTLVYLTEAEIAEALL